MKTIMLLGAATLLSGGAATAQMSQPSGATQGQTGASAPAATTAAPAATTAAPASSNDQATTADLNNSSDKIAAAREKAKKDKAKKDKKDQKTDNSTTPQ
jgi:hypothetical protein